MTDKYRAQARFGVEVRLERKNAEHKIEKTRHLFDSATIPSPYLRADVINYFWFRRLLPQCPGEAQVETGIIDQHDSVGFVVFNFVECFTKLSSKITILLDHLPQTKDSCIVDPIFELGAGDRPHLWTAASNKREIDARLAQRTHQRGPVIVSARFAGDKIDRLRFHLLLQVVATAWRAVCTRLTEARLQHLALEYISELQILDAIRFVILTANSSAAVTLTPETHGSRPVLAHSMKEMS